MSTATSENRRRTRPAGSGEVARQRALRDAAQRGRVQAWARGAQDPEVDVELSELIAKGILDSDVSLADQRARWAYLEAAWEVAGRPDGDASSARRAIAGALSHTRQAA